MSSVYAFAGGVVDGHALKAAEAIQRAATDEQAAHAAALFMRKRVEGLNDPNKVGAALKLAASDLMAFDLGDRCEIAPTVHQTLQVEFETAFGCPLEPPPSHRAAVAARYPYSAPAGAPMAADVIAPPTLLERKPFLCRDYDVYIDFSGSMLAKARVGPEGRRGKKTRLQLALEEAERILHFVVDNKLDPDGISIMIFNAGIVETFEEITTVEQLRGVFAELSANPKKYQKGGTDVLCAVEDFVLTYNENRAAKLAKDPDYAGASAFVISDAAPDNPEAVKEYLGRVSRGEVLDLRDHTELGVTLVQVGFSSRAGDFPAAVDTGLGDGMDIGDYQHASEQKPVLDMLEHNLFG